MRVGRSAGGNSGGGAVTDGRVSCSMWDVSGPKDSCPVEGP